MSAKPRNTKTRAANNERIDIARNASINLNVRGLGQSATLAINERCKELEHAGLHREVVLPAEDPEEAARDLRGLVDDLAPAFQIGQVLGNHHPRRFGKIDRAERSDVGHRIALAGNEFMALQLIVEDCQKYLEQKIAGGGFLQILPENDNVFTYKYSFIDNKI